MNACFSCMTFTIDILLTFIRLYILSYAHPLLYDYIFQIASAAFSARMRPFLNCPLISTSVTSYACFSFATIDCSPLCNELSGLLSSTVGFGLSILYLVRSVSALLFLVELCYYLIINGNWIFLHQSKHTPEDGPPDICAIEVAGKVCCPVTTSRFCHNIP
jgi:hypothetical protein